MNVSNALVLLVLLSLSGNTARAQLKDMPSQAEFDPILESADNKLKDFVAPLTDFRVEATEIVLHFTASNPADNTIISTSQISGTVEVMPMKDWLVIGRDTPNQALVNFGRWKAFGYEQMQAEFEESEMLKQFADQLGINPDEAITMGLVSGDLKLTLMIFSVPHVVTA